jgi:phage major head subunit gpT-like protein
VTDAALVDLLRTLLDAIRENRADIDGQEVRIYQSLERELTRTIDAFVDAVVFGNDAYVEAIYRIQ